MKITFEIDPTTSGADMVNRYSPSLEATTPATVPFVVGQGLTLNGGSSTAERVGRNDAASSSYVVGSTPDNRFALASEGDTLEATKSAGSARF
jgi:hypothetical protein